jgi:hypothetical protein
MINAIPTFRNSVVIILCAIILIITFSMFLYIEISGKHMVQKCSSSFVTIPTILQFFIIVFLGFVIINALIKIFCSFVPKKNVEAPKSKTRMCFEKGWKVIELFFFIMGIFSIISMVFMFGLWMGGTYLTVPDTKSDLKINGLLNKVSVNREPNGVIHILASSDQDLYFTQGFVLAQERLFQLDFSRRLANGRLSEVVGCKFIINFSENI